MSSVAVWHDRLIVGADDHETSYAFDETYVISQLTPEVFKQWNLALTQVALPPGTTLELKGDYYTSLVFESTEDLDELYIRVEINGRFLSATNLRMALWPKVLEELKELAGKYSTLNLEDEA